MSSGWEARDRFEALDRHDLDHWLTTFNMRDAQLSRFLDLPTPEIILDRQKAMRYEALAAVFWHRAKELRASLGDDGE